MDDPSAPDAQPPERPGRRTPVDRAVLLLGLFVLAVVLLLGTLHPLSAHPSNTATEPTTTASSPSTTRPPAASTTTTAPKPSNVPVLVANASGTPGAAASVTNQLQVAGWNVQAPINASANVSTSSVYYVAGQKASAIAVAATLHLPPSVVLPYTTAAPVSTIGTAEVLVVVAPDLTTGPATTTTTAGT